MIFTLPTSLGIIAVELNGDAITQIRLEAIQTTAEQIQNKNGLLQQRRSRDLKRYFAGDAVSFLDYELDLSELPEFTQQVLQATRRIQYGGTASYRDVACMLGRPQAARAVGQALSRNPIAIVIPCHRVIGSDGRLIGFAGGIKWKKYLLDLEEKGRGGESA